jgi:phosphoglycolate phosphatase-like HAD superfamily hydrolase
VNAAVRQAPPQRTAAPPAFVLGSGLVLRPGDVVALLSQNDYFPGSKGALCLQVEYAGDGKGGALHATHVTLVGRRIVDGCPVEDVNIAANVAAIRPQRPAKRRASASFGQPPSHPIEAIIFDFDDTLLATATTRWPALIETAAEFQFTLTEATIAAAWGRPFNELIAATVPPTVGQDAFVRRYREVMHTHPPQPTTGAVDLLRRLWRAGICLCVVSSSSQGLVVQDLDALSLTGYFSYIFGHEQTRHHKPDPRVLDEPREALAHLLIGREGILCIGDSGRDFLVATGNNIAFYAVMTGSEDRPRLEQAGVPPETILTDLSELIPIVRA